MKAKRGRPPKEFHQRQNDALIHLREAAEKAQDYLLGTPLAHGCVLLPDGQSILLVDALAGIVAALAAVE